MPVTEVRRRATSDWWANICSSAPLSTAAGPTGLRSVSRRRQALSSGRCPQVLTAEAVARIMGFLFQKHRRFSACTEVLRRWAREGIPLTNGLVASEAVVEDGIKLWHEQAQQTVALFAAVEQETGAAGRDKMAQPAETTAAVQCATQAMHAEGYFQPDAVQRNAVDSDTLRLSEAAMEALFAEAFPFLQQQVVEECQNDDVGMPSRAFVAPAAGDHAQDSHGGCTVAQSEHPASSSEPPHHGLGEAEPSVEKESATGTKRAARRRVWGKRPMPQVSHNIVPEYVGAHEISCAARSCPSPACPAEPCERLQSPLGKNADARDELNQCERQLCVGLHDGSCVARQPPSPARREEPWEQHRSLSRATHADESKTTCESLLVLTNSASQPSTPEAMCSLLAPPVALSRCAPTDNTETGASVACFDTVAELNLHGSAEPPQPVVPPLAIADGEFAEKSEKPETSGAQSRLIDGTAKPPSPTYGSGALCTPLVETDPLAHAVSISVSKSEMPVRRRLRGKRCLSEMTSPGHRVVARKLEFHDLGTAHHYEPHALDRRCILQASLYIGRCMRAMMKRMACTDMVCAGSGDTGECAAYTNAMRGTIPQTIAEFGKRHQDLSENQIEGFEWLASHYIASPHCCAIAGESRTDKIIQLQAFFAFVLEEGGEHGPHLLVVPQCAVSHWQSGLSRPGAGCSLHMLASHSTEAEREAITSEVVRTKQQAVSCRHRAVVCLATFEALRSVSWVGKVFWETLVFDAGMLCRTLVEEPRVVCDQQFSSLCCKARLAFINEGYHEEEWNCFDKQWWLARYLFPQDLPSVTDFRAWLERQEDYVLDPLTPPQQDALVVWQPHTIRPACATQRTWPEAASRAEEEAVMEKLRTFLAPFVLDRSQALPPLSERMKKESAGSSRYTDQLRDLELQADRSGLQQAAQKAMVRRATEPNQSGREATLKDMHKLDIHPYLLQDAYGVGPNLYRVSGRLEALDRLLLKLLPCGRKVIVVSHLDAMLDILVTYAKWRKFPVSRVDQQTMHRECYRQVRRFAEEPEVVLLLVDSEASQHHVDLAGALRRHGGAGLVADTLVVVFDEPFLRRFDPVVSNASVFLNALRHDGAGDPSSSRCAAGRFSAGLWDFPSLRFVRATDEATDDDPVRGSSTAQLNEVAGQINALLGLSGPERAIFDTTESRLLQPRQGAPDNWPPLLQSGRLTSMEEVSGTKQ